jgi:hypothetical protein
VTGLSPTEATQHHAALDFLELAVENVYDRLVSQPRRRVALEEIMTCRNLEPQFEERFEIDYRLHQRFPLLRLPKFLWFYSVKGWVGPELVLGALLGGDLIVVEAATREGADQLAAKGLASTVEVAKDLKYNLLMLPDAVENPMETVEKTAAGRRATQGAPMRGDMAEKFDRMMTDVFKPKAPKYRRKR